MAPAELAKTVAIAFLLFLSSNFDVFADGQLSYFYFAGATYDFIFQNMSDPTIAQCVLSLDFFANNLLNINQT